MKPSLLAYMTVLLLAACHASPPSAELVLLNGKIITLEETQPEVEALAAAGDTILALGKNDEIRKFIGARTRVIDLQGKFAMPGFIEGHAHLVGLGQAQTILKLSRVKDWQEVAEMVKAAAEKLPAGTWIIGRGWHQEKFERMPEPNVDGYPTHDLISAVSPNHPVLLRHASGHLLFANKKAMELARISKETPSPVGGTIWRDRNGNAIGIFQETAQSLIEQAYQADLARRTPAEIDSAERQAIRLAIAEALSKGVTSFQDAGSSFETIDRLKDMADKGELPIRLWVMVSARETKLAERLPQYRLIGYAKHHLTVRAIKEYMDGALGSHGAWLLQPYSDLPSSTGQAVRSIEEIRATAALALKNGFQLCTHAIGDRANREVLNIYEQTFGQNGQNLRWRIEHAQHLDEADIPRFAKLGVIASMQAVHATSDAPFVLKRLSELRAQAGAYVWKKLLQTGAVVSNGTDAPVEDINPIACFYAAVTRKLKDGSVFFGDQAMTRLEALRSYTLAPAYAAFEEHLKGSLKVGKLADVVVLSKNLLTIPDEEILSTKVLCTIVGGKVVYENGLQ
ncbi:MAG: amidohydrolase [Chloroherpetonaceae bacterium]|nr:amidohydrolase [Chloroherpetonaceae bacterium]MCS7210834.1 amidohydrolase [Chloroherpetonaceae bacterium]MDW8020501.1 amidohydrolase [Chloroherpetonaceae bacterium]